MNLRAIGYVFGTLLLVTGAAMLLPAVCSLFYPGEGDLLPICAGAAISLAIGAPMWFLWRDAPAPGVRDAFFVAAFGWVIVSAVSALPFMFHGSIPSFTDAFFEMMSGYTTTGATVLGEIESLPHGLLLWRSETNMLGGMGFLTLALLFMPHGMGSVRMFRAESSPGQVPTREKFTPRNRDALLYLWLIYLALNGLQIVLLQAGGMPFYEALAHAFATVSTSGYSPMNASIGHYDSAYFDWVIILFMFLGGVSFALIFQAYRGQWRAVKINTELRWYVGLLLFFCAGVAISLYTGGTYDLVDSVRYGTFQVMSLLTTTGFTTADYELWPAPAQALLWVVCFIGACAGSTTSGIKIIHYAIIWKFMVASIRKLYLQPLAVVSVRLNNLRIDDSIINWALAYFVVNIFLVLGGACVMAVSDGMGMPTALSSVIATLMNVGPGFADVGPTHNYAFISSFGKWFLAWLMLVGRLEMFSALIVFYPAFWRR